MITELKRTLLDIGFNPLIHTLRMRLTENKPITVLYQDNTDYIVTTMTVKEYKIFKLNTFNSNWVISPHKDELETILRAI